MQIRTNEGYMNSQQIAYFKNRLIRQRMELEMKMSLQREKLKNMKDTQSDILDRSNFMVEMEREIRTQERYSGMARQITHALEKIDNGSFGYCELTGKKIGFRRLDAIPYATMSITALK